MTTSNKYGSFFFALIVIGFFVSAGTADADILGQRENFFVNKGFDKYGRLELGATLRQISGGIYFYIEDSYWDKLDFTSQNIIKSNMLDLGYEFANNIYPKETSLWGFEARPGVDGDAMITVLLEELKNGNGGYFDSSNGYSKLQAPRANEREMVVVSVEVAGADPQLAKVFLAHEFHHLISFNQKDILQNVSEEVWLNELRAEYSVAFAGYNKPHAGSNFERRLDLFLENPEDSLTEWPNNLIDYASVNVFGIYLVEQYGKEILSETLKNKSAKTGIPSINEYLALSGRAERFDRVFGHWMAAMYLNDVSGDGRFGYRDPDLKNIKVDPGQQVFVYGDFPETSTFQNLKPWQGSWLEFNLSSAIKDSSKSVKLSAVGEAGKIFPIFYLVFYNDGSVFFDELKMVRGGAAAYVADPGKFPVKIVVMPTNGTKLADFGDSEAAASLRIDVAVVPVAEAEAAEIGDGDLIRKKGEKEIYVVWGKYKRYLTAGVISFYGHLNPAKAIEVGPEKFNSYRTSNYVKYVDDEKVYAVWPPDEGLRGGTSTGIAPDGTKHWLNITPKRWDESGRDWGAIFVINDSELNYYKTGADITR